MPCAWVELEPVASFDSGRPKRMTAGNAEGFDFAAFFDELIDGLLSDAGHGADVLADVCAGADEHRVDQAAGGEAGFADEIAKAFGAA